MSAVTLETLRADFETKSQPFVCFLRERFNEWQSRYAAGYIPPRRLQNLRLTVPLRETRFITPEGIVDEWETADVTDGLCGSRMYYQQDTGVREAYQAAKIYLIARDHGLQAAMIFKLSDGAIDPRKVGDK